MPYQDLVLNCNACGNQFTIPAGEQEWLNTRFQGDYQPPKKCRGCRIRRKQEKASSE